MPDDAVRSHATRTLRRRWAIALTVVVVIALVVGIAVLRSDWKHSGGTASGPTPTSSASSGRALNDKLVPSHGALLGIASETTQGGMGVSELESDIGRRFAMQLAFFNFDSSGNDMLDKLDSATVRYAIRDGRIPMLTWQPQQSGHESVDMMPSIANGKYDAYITKVAKKMKGLDVPIMLRFAHEMNGDWYSWSGCSSSSCDPDAAKTYIAAWRHVYNVFKRAGASNVVWVWGVNNHDVVPDGTKGHHWSDFYPGDDYVDWVALDQYINTSSMSVKEAESKTIGSYLTDDKASVYSDYAGKKPIMIAESSIGARVAKGVDTEDFDKRTYFGNLVSDLREHPAIKAFAYFDTNGRNDYRVDNNDDNLAGFVTMARDCYLDPTGLQRFCR